MLKNKKAAGFDKFETKCQLKSGINHLSALLVRLFNFIIPKGTFPDSWSTGMITPIFKSGNRSDLQITEAFVLFYPILNTRLNVYFHDQNILLSSEWFSTRIPNNRL